MLIKEETSNILFEEPRAHGHRTNLTREPSSKGIEVKGIIRKSSKRIRTAFTTEQLQALEKIYTTAKYIDVKSRKELAKQLKIPDKALKIWFQNRRMREKNELIESSRNTSSTIFSVDIKL